MKMGGGGGQHEKTLGNKMGFPSTVRVHRAKAAMKQGLKHLSGLCTLESVKPGPVTTAHL